MISHFFTSGAAFQAFAENQQISLYGPKNAVDRINFHEDFLREYLFYDKENAVKNYLNSPYIDINYNNGLFLFKAAEAGDISTLTLLLEKGADVGLTDALGAAAHNGHEDIVTLLIERGADPEIIRDTEAYDQYAHIQVLLDQKIAERANIQKR